MQQMPVEGRRFKAVDETWRSLMRGGLADPKALRALRLVLEGSPRLLGLLATKPAVDPLLSCLRPACTAGLPGGEADAASLAASPPAWVQQQQQQGVAPSAAAAELEVAELALTVLLRLTAHAGVRAAGLLLICLSPNSRLLPHSTPFPHSSFGATCLLFVHCLPARPCPACRLHRGPVSGQMHHPSILAGPPGAQHRWVWLPLCVGGVPRCLALQNVGTACLGQVPAPLSSLLTSTPTHNPSRTCTPTSAPRSPACSAAAAGAAPAARAGGHRCLRLGRRCPRRRSLPAHPPAAGIPRWVRELRSSLHAASSRQACTWPICAPNKGLPSSLPMLHNHAFINLFFVTCSARGAAGDIRSCSGGGGVPAGAAGGPPAARRPHQSHPQVLPRLAMPALPAAYLPVGCLPAPFALHALMSPPTLLPLLQQASAARAGGCNPGWAGGGGSGGPGPGKALPPLPLPLPLPPLLSAVLISAVALLQLFDMHGCLLTHYCLPPAASLLPSSAGQRDARAGVEPQHGGSSGRRGRPPGGRRPRPAGRRDCLWRRQRQQYHRQPGVAASRGLPPAVPGAGWGAGGGRVLCAPLLEGSAVPPEVLRQGMLYCHAVLPCAWRPWHAAVLWCCVVCAACCFCAERRPPPACPSGRLPHCPLACSPN